jgi:hypothetical protein
MPNNYVLLEKIVVGSAGASSVTFANIPQTGYTDLVVKASARTTYASTVEGSTITFNGSNTYSGRYLQGDGSSASSGSQSILNALLFNAATATASTFGNSEMYIPNYTSTNQKSVSGDGVSENNATQAFAGLFASLATLTSGITTITIAGNAGGSFIANSTFYLYGVAKLGTTPAIAPKATGGDVVMTDGTYWYHQFNASGTFTPAVALSCDYLVVAGGGAGGAADTADFSGGGGAGGLRSTVTATGGGGSLESALSLASGTGYTVTIGAGGTASSASWTNGSNSVFSTITSTGGGAGGGLNSSPSWVLPAVGGSGGGGTEANTAGAAGTANQGRAGGTSPGGPSGNSGGGGGGASAVGSNGTTNNGGAGGAGVATSITGTSVTYAGGGGGSGSSSGGAGGSGGGGAGSTGTATAGTANTGGGGGSGVRSGAAGGSGVVVVRYLVA